MFNRCRPALSYLSRFNRSLRISSGLNSVWRKMSEQNRAITSQSTLPRDSVHVWLADIDSSGVDQPHALKLLNADELSRAGQFRRRLDRLRFATGRAFLLLLLADYLAACPE